jgi:hypothetical protein
MMSGADLWVAEERKGTAKSSGHDREIVKRS